MIENEEIVGFEELILWEISIVGGENVIEIKRDIIFWFWFILVVIFVRLLFLI